MEGMLEKLVEEIAEGRGGGRSGVVELGIVVVMKELSVFQPTAER
jgi:hypothetical protein